MCDIRFGNVEHEFLLIQIVCRESTDSLVPDYYENNWLNTLVEVRAGDFQANVTCNLLADDLVLLRDRLQKLLDWKEDSVDFTTLEGELRLTFMLDSRGQMTVIGDLLGGENRLRFVLDIDQSYLPAILRDLDVAAAKYPVIGTPPLPQ